MTDAAARAEAPERQALDLDGLPDLLGFHIRLAQAAFYRDFASSLAHLDLTQRQLAVLKIIKANPGVSQVDIAALLGTDRATMMAIVDRLQGRGLLERRRSNTDRRRQELTTTPAGDELLGEADKAIAAHEARFTSLFSQQELAALFDALRRIHRAV